MPHGDVLITPPTCSRGDVFNCEHIGQPICKEGSLLKCHPILSDKILHSYFTPHNTLLSLSGFYSYLFYCKPIRTLAGYVSQNLSHECLSQYYILVFLY